MDLNSENIPESLRAYVERFREDPSEAIQRLEAQLGKRGNDAVGYYLLSWFFHYTEQRDKAVKAAWKAKIYAPGSPVMEKLHYYMQHPETFRAWNPAEPERKRSESVLHKKQGYPIPDLDLLIEKLSAVDSERVRIDLNNTSDSDDPDLSSLSERVDDIVTETLATIHEKQGNYREALRTYERLLEIEPERKEDFQQEIKRLQRHIERGEHPADE
ncbi:MAG: tetratricopeptide repeat protein [Balneolaceae bacterium]